jgi:hypothetical protein
MSGNEAGSGLYNVLFLKDGEHQNVQFVSHSISFGQLVEEICMRFNVTPDTFELVHQDDHRTSLTESNFSVVNCVGKTILVKSIGCSVPVYSQTVDIHPHPSGVTDIHNYAIPRSTEFQHPLPYLIAELVDNCIEAFQTAGADISPSIEVAMFCNGDNYLQSLAVIDNATGMTFSEVRDFCRWSVPKDERHSQPAQPSDYPIFACGRFSVYGRGAKHACFFMGQVVRVVSKAASADRPVTVCMDAEVFKNRELVGEKWDQADVRLLNPDEDFLMPEEKSPGVLRVLEQLMKLRSFTMVLISKLALERFAPYYDIARDLVRLQGVDRSLKPLRNHRQQTLAMALKSVCTVYASQLASIFYYYLNPLPLELQGTEEALRLLRERNQQPWHTSIRNPLCAPAQAVKMISMRVAGYNGTDLDCTPTVVLDCAKLEGRCYEHDLIENSEGRPFIIDWGRRNYRAVLRYYPHRFGGPSLPVEEFEGADEVVGADGLLEAADGDGAAMMRRMAADWTDEAGDSETEGSSHRILEVFWNGRRLPNSHCCKPVMLSLKRGKVPPSAIGRVKGQLFLSSDLAPVVVDKFKLKDDPVLLLHGGRIVQAVKDLEGDLLTVRDNFNNWMSECQKLDEYFTLSNPAARTSACEPTRFLICEMSGAIVGNSKTSMAVGDVFTMDMTVLDRAAGKDRFMFEVEYFCDPNCTEAVAQHVVGYATCAVKLFPFEVYGYASMEIPLHRILKEGLFTDKPSLSPLVARLKRLLPSVYEVTFQQQGSEGELTYSTAKKQSLLEVAVGTVQYRFAVRNAENQVLDHRLSAIPVPRDLKQFPKRLFHAHVSVSAPSTTATALARPLKTIINSPSWVTLNGTMVFSQPLVQSGRHEIVVKVSDEKNPAADKKPVSFSLVIDAKSDVVCRLDVQLPHVTIKLGDAFDVRVRLLDAFDNVITLPEVQLIADILQIELLDDRQAVKLVGQGESAIVDLEHNVCLFQHLEIVPSERSGEFRAGMEVLLSVKLKSRKLHLLNAGEGALPILHSTKIVLQPGSVCKFSHGIIWPFEHEQILFTDSLLPPIRLFALDRYGNPVTFESVSKVKFRGACVEHEVLIENSTDRFSQELRFASLRAISFEALAVNQINRPSRNPEWDVHIAITVQWHDTKQARRDTTVSIEGLKMRPLPFPVDVVVHDAAGNLFADFKRTANGESRTRSRGDAASLKPRQSLFESVKKYEVGGIFPPIVLRFLDVLGRPASFRDVDRPKFKIEQSSGYTIAGDVPLPWHGELRLIDLLQEGQDGALTFPCRFEMDVYDVVVKIMNEHTELFTCKLCFHIIATRAVRAELKWIACSSSTMYVPCTDTYLPDFNLVVLDKFANTLLPQRIQSGKVTLHLSKGGGLVPYEEWPEGRIVCAPVSSSDFRQRPLVGVTIADVSLPKEYLGMVRIKAVFQESLSECLLESEPLEAEIVIGEPARLQLLMVDGGPADGTCLSVRSMDMLPRLLLTVQDAVGNTLDPAVMQSKKSKWNCELVASDDVQHLCPRSELCVKCRPSDRCHFDFDAHAVVVRAGVEFITLTFRLRDEKRVIPSIEAAELTLAVLPCEVVRSVEVRCSVETGQLREGDPCPDILVIPDTRILDEESAINISRSLSVISSFGQLIYSSFDVRRNALLYRPAPIVTLSIAAFKVSAVYEEKRDGFPPGAWHVRSNELECLPLPSVQRQEEERRKQLLKDYWENMARLLEEKVQMERTMVSSFPNVPDDMKGLRDNITRLLPDLNSATAKVVDFMQKIDLLSKPGFIADERASKLSREQIAFVRAKGLRRLVDYAYARNPDIRLREGEDFQGRRLADLILLDATSSPDIIQQKLDEFYLESTLIAWRIRSSLDCFVAMDKTVYESAARLGLHVIKADAPNYAKEVADCIAGRDYPQHLVCRRAIDLLEFNHPTVQKCVFGKLIGNLYFTKDISSAVHINQFREDQGKLRYNIVAVKERQFISSTTRTGGREDKFMRDQFGALPGRFGNGCCRTVDCLRNLRGYLTAQAEHTSDLNKALQALRLRLQQDCGLSGQEIDLAEQELIEQVRKTDRDMAVAKARTDSFQGTHAPSTGNRQQYSDPRTAVSGAASGPQHGSAPQHYQQGRRGGPAEPALVDPRKRPYVQDSTMPPSDDRSQNGRSSKYPRR